MSEESAKSWQPPGAAETAGPARESRRETMPAADLSALGFLALLTLCVFANILFFPHGRVLSASGWDLSSEFIHWRDFGFRELRAGHLPLWNPYSFCGTPFFGGFQSALLYPPNLLFLFLPLGPAINWSIALHVFLAGAFTWLWVRNRGLHPLACLLAATMFMFGGPYFLHIFAGHLSNLCTLVWAPLLFLAIDRIFDRPALGPCLLGAFAAAMAILAGHVQYVFYLAVAAAIYSALNLACQPRAAARAIASERRGIPRTLLCLLAICLGAAALSAVQLFTGFAEAGEGVRSVGLSYKMASQFSFPPENYLTLVAPGFFGDLKIMPYWGRCYLFEMSLFVSLTGLVLAVSGALGGDRRARRFSFTMFILLLVLALGAHTPLFPLLYHYAPGFNKFRGSSKFISLAALFLSLLAAAGFDRILKQQRVARGLLACTLAGGVVLGALALCLDQAALDISAQAWWPAALHKIQATGEMFSQPGILPGQFADPPFILYAGKHAAMTLLSGAVALFVLSLLLFLSNRSRRWAVGIGLFALVELLLFARASLITFEPERSIDPLVRQTLEQHPGDYRILDLLDPNSALSLRVEDIGGDDPGVLRRYAELIAFTQGQDPDKVTQYLRLRHDNVLGGMLRHRFTFSRQDGETVALETTNVLPRLQLVSRFRVMSQRDQILRALSNATFNPRDEVILETVPKPEPQLATQPGVVKLLDFSSDRLTLEADLKTPAILLITDSYAKGWRARPDGPSAQSHYEILPANYCLRAIPLQAGRHRLRVEYSPVGFRAGAWVSLASVALFLALAPGCVRRGLVRSGCRLRGVPSGICSHLADLWGAGLGETPGDASQRNPPLRGSSTPTEPGRPDWHRRRAVLAAFAIPLLTILVYLPALHGGFIWDDDILVTKDRLLKSWEGLWSIWFSTEPYDYLPLTLTSFWLEWRLWGLNASGYHLTNVLLHGASALLLWRVLRRLQVPGAWLGAVLFAIHPVCAGSVAWIAERKNTLSLVFYLLSLLWYLRFDELALPQHAARNTQHATPPVPSSLFHSPSSLYLLSLAAFLLALLSKGSVVMLPVILLLCVWWRCGEQQRREPMVESREPQARPPAATSPGPRISRPRPSTFDPRLFWQLVPFFALSLVFGLLTVWFQSHRSMGGVGEHTDALLVRLLGGSWAVWFYLGKALLPFNLSMIYPRWPINPASAISYLPALLLLGLLALLWRSRVPWARPLLFGFGCFVVNLVPVLGFFDIYFFTFARAADHFQYLALIGLLVLVAAGLARGLGRPAPNAGVPSPGWRSAVYVIPASALVLCLSVLTWHRAAVFAHPLSLWRDAVQKNPRSWVTRNNYGNALEAHRQFDEAAFQYTQALRFNPDNVDAHINMGIVLTKQGRLDEATRHLQRALQIAPTYPGAHFNLAAILSKQARFDEAIGHYQAALQSRGYLPEAHNNLGNIFSQQGKPEAALAHYAEALRLDPDFVEAHNNLGNLLGKQGRLQDALAQYAEVVRLNLSHPNANYNLGRAALEQGRLTEAIARFRIALQGQPEFAEAHHNLALALELQGRTVDAAEHYRAALRVKPDLAGAHYHLANLLLKQKHTDEARRHFMEALRSDPAMAEAHYQLGVIAAEQKDTVETIKRWQEALRLKPDWLEPLNNLAWLLATHPDPKVRNGTQAVKLALRATGLTRQRDAGAFDTLAAAYAEAGQYKEAVAAAEQALKLANASGDKELVNQIQAHLDLYRTGRPFRE